MKLSHTYSAQRSLVLVLGVLGLQASPDARSSSYSDTILADKPVAYYRFEDAADSTAASDSSVVAGYPGILNFDGLNQWPKLGQPGLGSNSVSFHVSSDPGAVPSYVSVPYTSELNLPGPFTAEGWARPASVGVANEWRSPIGNFGGWGDSSGWFFYQSPGDPGPSSWIWVQKGGGVWLGGGDVRKNQWDHLVASFDGTNVTFYVNGVKKGSADAATALPNSGRPFCIGQRADSNCYFDGNVDEVAIYTNALSESQIQLHYQVGLTNFYSGPIGAYVTQDPAPATSYAGRPVSFVVSADGTAPLAYQWYRGNSLLAGQTTDTLTLNCVYADNNAAFSVVVTNLYGSATSAPAVLTVSTELILASSPASITRNVGSAAAFRAEGRGALPLSYQWFKGAAPIPAATNDTLWLSKVQLADDASAYYAQVSNPWHSTNSESGTLTVVARTVDVPITGYAKIVMADQPVGYWRLDEPDGSTTSVDATGSFDGEYNSAGAGNFLSGAFTYAAGTGVPYETNKAVVVTNGARIIIPYALELNPHGPFAVEAWLQPSSLAADGSDYRTALSSEGNGAGGPIGWLLYQQPNNTWAWVVFADNWVSSFIGDPINTLVANNWYHVVLQYDGSLFHVYVNGKLATSQAFNIFVPNSNGAINLGWRSDNDFLPFAGAIDEVAFYNKALTPEQIQAHYLATVRLTVIRSGPDIVLSWPFGTLQQADSPAGSFTPLAAATSPYTNSPGSGTRFYRVKVQ
jgi:hypothetical protein